MILHDPHFRLLSVGVIPIIRCPRNNAAEVVAEKLDKKIRETMRDSKNTLFSFDNMLVGQRSFNRPLLIILDRDVDLATPLHHTWTYQALAHDVLVKYLHLVGVVLVTLGVLVF